MRIDPRWIEAAHEHREWFTGACEPEAQTASAPIPPRDLSGDQIKLSKSLSVKSAGFWLIWTARGPITCSRFRGELWEMREDPVICELYKDGAGRLKQWLEDQRLCGVKFKTRREAVSALRAALLRSSSGEPAPADRADEISARAGIR